MTEYFSFNGYSVLLHDSLYVVYDGFEQVAKFVSFKDLIDFVGGDYVSKEAM